jgi:hypothetical protein
VGKGDTGVTGTGVAVPGGGAGVGDWRGTGVGVAVAGAVVIVGVRVEVPLGEGTLGWGEGSTGARHAARLRSKRANTVSHLFIPTVL